MIKVEKNDVDNDGDHNVDHECVELTYSCARCNCRSMLIV